MYKGLGVHHVGMGVRNLELMKAFYWKTLEFTKVFEEFSEQRNPMPEMFRNSEHIVQGGIMLDQEAEGVIVELIQLRVPSPRPIHKEIKYGDIGINKMTIAVSDVEVFYREYQGKVTFSSEPKSTKITDWGDYHFVYGRDPEGNLIEFVSAPKVRVERGFGGIRWLGLSVTDLERSVAFYQEYLGFDKVVVRPHVRFSGLVDEISGNPDTQVRSCLLANSRGGGMLEIYEVLKPRGRSLPFDARWGDFGCMELALMCDDIHEMGKYFEQEGMEFLSRPAFVPLTEPEGEGWYVYFKDPDGFPVEVISVVPKQ
jgi:catechol 2,3-dioxygenase-like lactoylglutathione lyase family enzyme